MSKYSGYADFILRRIAAMGPDQATEYLALVLDEISVCSREEGRAEAQKLALMEGGQ